MTMNPNNGFSLAREREHHMMSLLAEVACGRHKPDGSEPEDVLRQLGYGAALSRGRVEDPDNLLGDVVRFCHEQVKNKQAPNLSYRDHVQARWGAAWHMDVGKLKTELPLHMMKLRRQETAAPSF